MSRLSPESMMMSYGYDPHRSEGSIKCPIFQTATYVFKTAEEGKAFFQVAYGHRKRHKRERTGLIYSRINHPDMEVLEQRLKLWDGAEDCAAFASGMSAITTVMLEFLNPGDLLLYSQPLYGGTHHFIHQILSRFDIQAISFRPEATDAEIVDLLQRSGGAEKLAMIYVETPANPTNELIDIERCARLARRFSRSKKTVILAVDNTYMGPLWQHPLSLGADLVLYSATKYIGGHSDVIAGAVLGPSRLVQRVKTLRTFLGNGIDPHTGWLLLRSLETLKVRMEQQAFHAERIVEWLREHPLVERIYYPGFLEHQSPEQYAIYRKQCLGKGAMLSFDIRGGEREAFWFLNHLKLVKLAVSLGSTESLAEHPATMTHADVPEAERTLCGITPKMIRLSVGLEHYADIIWDLDQALDQVGLLREPHHDTLTF